MSVDALVRDALALIAGQDVEPASGSDGTDGRWQIARKVAADRVISISDPDARHIHKTVHRRQDGFKAHIAVEPGTGITTACELNKGAGTQASAQDLADSADATDEALDTITKAGRRPLVKPGPLKPAVEGGFTLDDFQERLKHC